MSLGSQLLFLAPWEGTFLSKIFGLHHCSANEYTNTYCLSPSVLVKKKMKVPKGSKYQDCTLVKKNDWRKWGKNNDQENELQISKSQPTTKRANKFIIQNIKIATTPVVPIPLRLQDVVKIATTPVVPIPLGLQDVVKIDFCSPNYKISRLHHQMEQRSNKRAKRFNMQPPNGIKIK